MSTEDDTIEKVQSKFGGKWEVYAGGRTIIGVGTGTDINGLVQTFTNGSTGGEYTHKLTIAEMPSHNHTPQLEGTGFATYGSNGGNSNWTYSGNNMLYGGTQITGNTGGNGSHNNVEPYIATYIYKRIG